MRGQSIVDYVFANPQAQRTIKGTKVWEAEWVAGSDYRVMSCDTECDIHLDEPVLSLPNSTSRSSQCVWKIRSSDLDNPDTQEAVRRQFDTNRPFIRAMVENEIGHLVYGGGLCMREQATAALNKANDILSRYIIDSLRNGGLAERPFKPATSRFFWGEELSRPKRERDSLWRASRQKDNCYESRQILADRAAEADRLLKKTVRERKTVSLNSQINSQRSRLVSYSK